MFVVTIEGYKGKLYLGKDLRPCAKKTDARLFKTRQAGASYILKHWRLWEGVKNGTNTMTIEEL